MENDKVDIWLKRQKTFAPIVIGVIMWLYLISNDYNFFLSIAIGIACTFALYSGMKSLENNQSSERREEK